MPIPATGAVTSSQNSFQPSHYRERQLFLQDNDISSYYFFFQDSSLPSVRLPFRLRLNFPVDGPLHFLPFLLLQLFDYLLLLS